MQRQSELSSLTFLHDSVSEETIIARLQDHRSMIEQNPLVIHYERCPAPADASDESVHVWFTLTDRIDYVPGLLQGKIHYQASFHDTPRGLRTHIHAPLGVEIWNEWTVCSNRTGSEVEPELKDKPEGVYLREKVELRCPFGMAFFVRRNIEKSHSTLVERLSESVAGAAMEGHSSHGGASICHDRAAPPA
ncbi:hypothetical protein N7541_007234 [Penicillium brevicompactum]|uniref:DUF7053 domain-containing protein n=1 Tax=Penicillium brevicompactum TaxID=5074 RepID=A0A9W9QS76_PENBR|nr:uncharacterized protein N7506_011082 [Penicillium brevicompactum]KAJ5321952.1 hypothetical protein N7506_011082 [Penicillium brevicompactum]KAJ5344735.1 hypothetical protein N7452_002739 [Penicillium brevicompactum]KAJ5349507.1 hypothetical protein N7541_007234 [Penicillium brevicompactum]